MEQMIRMKLLLRPQTLVAALPFLVALVIYAPSLRNGFAIIDDGLLIFENNLIRTISPRTLWVAFTSYDPELYIPLTLVSYQIDYLIGGYHPFIYHCTNVLLHAGSALFVSAIFSLLGVGRRMAILSGIVFALHPLHVEAVAWAAARKDILSSFFFLGSLLAYITCIHRQVLNQKKGTSAKCVMLSDRKNPSVCFDTIFGSAEPKITQHDTLGFLRLYRSTHFAEVPKGIFFIVSLVLFLLALLSKATALSLPLILLTVHLLIPAIPRKKICISILPFFALSFIFGVIALGGKSAMIAARTPVEFVLLACKTTIFALLQILFPFHLSVFYPELTSVTLFNPVYAASVILLIFLSVLLWKLRRNKTLLFGAFFFLATLAPSFLAVVKGGNTFFFSDRYAYLPSIGILFIIVSVMQDKRVLWSQHERMLLGAILCVLTLFTMYQSLLWGNSTKLFAQATRAYPDFYLAHINLGASLRQEGKPEEALREFRTAITLHPLPNTYGLIGQIEAERGNFIQSVKEFEAGLSLLPTDPELLYGLGQVYALMGETEKAQKAYEQALAVTEAESNIYRTFARRISARRDMILLRMGILVGSHGNHEEAVALYQRALEENPYNAEAHYNLAVGLGNLDRAQEAIQHYEATVDLNPRHIQALVNLGISYEKSGRRLEAIRMFRKTIEVDPVNTIANAALRSFGVL